MQRDGGTERERERDHGNEGAGEGKEGYEYEALDLIKSPMPMNSRRQWLEHSMSVQGSIPESSRNAKPQSFSPTVHKMCPRPAQLEAASNAETLKLQP